MPRAVQTKKACICLLVSGIFGRGVGHASSLLAAESELSQTIRGSVQNQDLRRVHRAVVEVKNQEGMTIATAVTNDAGEFSITIPTAGIYSVSAVQETYRSEYVVLKVGTDPPKPFFLNDTKTTE